jgi:hypothetical protein
MEEGKWSPQQCVNAGKKHKNHRQENGICTGFAVVIYREAPKAHRTGT